MDLSDADTRDAVTARLAERYAGRPVLMGPGVLGRLHQPGRLVPRPGVPGTGSGHRPRCGSDPRAQRLRGGPDRAAARVHDDRRGAAAGPNRPPSAAARHRRHRRLRPGPARGLVRVAVRHHRPADRRPAGRVRSPGGVPGPRGQDARRRDLGRGRSGPGAVPRRAQRGGRSRRGDRRAVRPTGCGLVGRRPRRGQRRRQLRALDRRRGRPAHGRLVLQAALRPDPGDAVPRRGAVLDPWLRRARWDRRLPPAGDREPARRGATTVRLRRARHPLGPARRRPGGDARSGPTRG